MFDIGCIKIFVGKRQTAKSITFPLKTGWIFLTKMFIIVIIFQTIQKIKISKEMIFHENFTSAIMGVSFHFHLRSYARSPITAVTILKIKHDQHESSFFTRKSFKNYD